MSENCFSGGFRWEIDFNGIRSECKFKWGEKHTNTPSSAQNADCAREGVSLLLVFIKEMDVGKAGLWERRPSPG